MMPPIHGALAAALERDAYERQHRLLSSPHDAHDLVQSETAAVAGAKDGLAAAMRDLAAREAELDAASGRADAVRTRISEIQEANAARLEREAEALRNGGEVPLVSSTFTDHETERLERHLKILEEPLAGLRLAVAGAREALGRAKDRLAQADHDLAHAKAVSVFAALVPALVSEGFPELNAYFALEPNRKKRDLLLERIARSLAPVLPPEAIKALGRGPVVTVAAPSEPVVELIVRDGNVYGGVPAGERVTVTQREAEFQLRRSPINGEPVGSLMTMVEYEQQQQARAEAEAERARKREEASRVPSVGDLIGEGLARLSAQGEAKAAEKAAAEERRRRSEADLERIRQHQLACIAEERPSAVLDHQE